jgi:hypothetical protein
VECVSSDFDDNYRIIRRLVADSGPEEKKMRQRQRGGKPGGKRENEARQKRSAGNEEMRRKRGFRDTMQQMSPLIILGMEFGRSLFLSRFV